MRIAIEINNTLKNGEILSSTGGDLIEHDLI